MSRYSWAAIAAGVFFFAHAQNCNAQLIVGGTAVASSLPPSYYIDVTTDPDNPRAYVLWGNSVSSKKINGVAADDVGGRLFSNDAARLNVWNYGSVGTAPTLIAGMYRSNGGTPAATGFDDLVYANDTLYGYTTFASSTYKRGLYRIPLTPNASNQLITVPVWEDPNTVSGTQYKFSLAYNAAANNFYGINSVTGAPGGAGIFTMDAFGTGGLTFLASFPDVSAFTSLFASFTDWDGLALGGGKLWLTTHDLADSSILIASYNLATQSYDDFLLLPYDTTTQRATGATWSNAGFATVVPEPGMLVATLPLASLLRRRR